MVVCVQSVVGKKNSIFQFEDGQKKEISSSLLVFLGLKGGVEMYELISRLPKKEEEGEFLTINGDPEVG